MVRKNVSYAKFDYIMLNGCMLGKEMALGVQSNSSAFSWIERDANGNATYTSHVRPIEFYQPLFFSTRSIKSGYKDVTLFSGFDDAVVPSNVSHSTVYHGGVSCSNLPHSEEDGTHFNAFWIFNRAVVPNEEDSTELKNWINTVIDGPDPPTEPPLHPAPSQVTQPKIKPIYLNHLYQRKRFYVPERSKLDII